jgi:hypothetical protein
VVDWYEREPPLRRVLVAELRRLKGRAEARWVLVVALAALLTAAVVYKVAKKPKQYRARIVLALTEGDLSEHHDATPLDQLRDYVGTVLLSNEKLLRIIEERDLFSLRKTHGDEYAIAELRDMFEINVWRNYFQYQQSYETRRSARIAVSFTHADPDFAYEMAQELTTVIIAGEGERRAIAARELADAARHTLTAARRRVDEVNTEVSAITVALARAEGAGRTGEASVLRLRAAELNLEVTRAQEAYLALEQAMTAEALQAEVTAAGLALQLEVVDERKPARPEVSRTTVLIMVGVVTWLIMLPIVAVVIGAFDTRVHDGDDVARLNLPVLGHVPGFPGDRVGALVARGAARTRMKGFFRWR